MFDSCLIQVYPLTMVSAVVMATHHVLMELIPMVQGIYPWLGCLNYNYSA